MWCNRVCILSVMVGLLLMTMISEDVFADTPPDLDYLWTGEAKWELDATGIGSSFGFHFPSMSWQGNEIWAYYIKHQLYGGITRFAVGRARSMDGLNWVDDGYCLPAGGIWRWIYQAQSSMYHLIGRIDGDGWSANCAQDDVGWLCYGPYTTEMHVGPNDAGFHLMIDNNSADDLVVVTIDVYDATSNKILATRNIRRREFSSIWTYQVFNLNFYVTDPGHMIEFRTYWYDRAYINELSVAVAEGYYPHWDSFNSSFPGVMKDPSDGIYYMVYEGSDGTSSSPGDIGLAISNDGMTFYRHPDNPILVHNDTGWERINIGTPSIMKDGSMWLLYYHGFGPSGIGGPDDCQIGVATGMDLLNLNKNANNPIIPTLPNTWQSGTTGKRSTLLQSQLSGLWYMAYEGSTEQPYSSAQWSTGIARSQNKISWDRFAGNPVIPQTPPGYGFGNDGPEMIRINGWTYLYVRSPYNGGCDRYKLVWR